MYIAILTRRIRESDMQSCSPPRMVSNVDITIRYAAMVVCFVVANSA